MHNNNNYRMNFTKTHNSWHQVKNLLEILARNKTNNYAKHITIIIIDIRVYRSQLLICNKFKHKKCEQIKIIS